MKRLRYIANQVAPEGIDEIQILLLCRRYGLHAALAGPPGTGKTETVREIAGLAGVPLHSKTCSTRTTESHIISHPTLQRDGEATVTRHENGPLVRAMEDGAIFYADEFNLLKEDTQKRLNSAVDDRRSIDRNDGVQVYAADGFWVVVSYNPSRGMTAHDLEESVADRFVHFQYAPWRPTFLAYVSALKAARTAGKELPSAKEYNLSLGYRGIDEHGEFYRAHRDKDGGLTWMPMFGNERHDTESMWTYRIFDDRSMLRDSGKEAEALTKALNKRAFGPTEFAHSLARLVDVINEMAESGSSPILKEIGLGDLHRQEDAGLLSVHKAGIRIISAALTVYEHLLSRGYHRFPAQSFATRLVVDQICYGPFRDRKLTSMTSHQLVTTVAKGLGLMAGSTKLNLSLGRDRTHAV